MIRDATMLDIPVLLELGKEMHAESAFSYLPFDEKKVSGLLAALISSPDGCLLVYEEKNEVVGGLAAVSCPFFFCHEVFATDLAVFVRKSRRGGRAVIELTRGYSEWADGRPAVRETHLGVSTGLKTDSVAKLYQRLGFSPRGGTFSRRVR